MFNDCIHEDGSLDLVLMEDMLVARRVIQHRTELVSVARLLAAGIEPFLVGRVASWETVEEVAKQLAWETVRAAWDRMDESIPV